MLTSGNEDQQHFRMSFQGLAFQIKVLPKNHSWNGSGLRIKILWYWFILRLIFQSPKSVPFLNWIHPKTKSTWAFSVTLFTAPRVSANHLQKISPRNVYDLEPHHFSRRWCRGSTYPLTTQKRGKQPEQARQSEANPEASENYMIPDVIMEFPIGLDDPKQKVILVWITITSNHKSHVEKRGTFNTLGALSLWTTAC